MYIIWPERRNLTPKQLITWAQDDIANGYSDLFASPEDVKTVEDARSVLNDSGSVTFGKLA